MPREGTETIIRIGFLPVCQMHPMPREGTETVIFDVYVVRRVECILCPVRGRKQGCLRRTFPRQKMHPMPREGTETLYVANKIIFVLMHPMPREGTET